MSIEVNQTAWVVRPKGAPLFSEHVGVGSGWVLRLIVRDGKPLLYAHGPEGGWQRVAKADATDRAWLRSSRWTPPLPEGIRWP